MQEPQLKWISEEYRETSIRRQFHMKSVNINEFKMSQEVLSEKKLIRTQLS